jgi:hypothetical protein
LFYFGLRWWWKQQRRERHYNNDYGNANCFLPGGDLEAGKLVRRQRRGTTGSDDLQYKWNRLFVGHKIRLGHIHLECEWQHTDHGDRRKCQYLDSGLDRQRQRRTHQRPGWWAFFRAYFDFAARVVCYLNLYHGEGAIACAIKGRGQRFVTENRRTSWLPMTKELRRSRPI